MLSTNRFYAFAMIWILLLCGACTVRTGDSDSMDGSPDAKPTFGVFTNPQPVTIEGYSQDAMEPFISPDGNYLFFNNSNSAPTTSLYYATAADDTGLTFQFEGELGGVNSMGPLNAVPSMDMNDVFYFVSTRSYAQTFSTIYSGTFSNGSVSNIAIVPGISKDKAGDVNFDQCISPDGSTLYFDDGVYTGSGQLLSASIAIAHRNGEQFARLKDSAKIMKQINRDGWNYAPDISKSGLEFFFTRFDSTQSGALPTIYTATRSKVSKPFGKPQKIAAITGFAEAPALSLDEKSLYYHLNVSGTFVIYRVTRP
jgi:Tol biopolymer transport system component